MITMLKGDDDCFCTCKRATLDNLKSYDHTGSNESLYRAFRHGYTGLEGANKHGMHQGHGHGDVNSEASLRLGKLSRVSASRVNSKLVVSLLRILRPIEAFALVVHKKRLGRRCA
jgi:hypothetical protein